MLSENVGLAGIDSIAVFYYDVFLMYVFMPHTTMPTQ